MTLSSRQIGIVYARQGKDWETCGSNARNFMQEEIILVLSINSLAFSCSTAIFFLRLTATMKLTEGIAEELKSGKGGEALQTFSRKLKDWLKLWTG